MIACDELGSFVGTKGQKQWVWLALNRETREMVGIAIEAHDETTAHQRWQSLPPVNRQCVICSTDCWDASACVLPSKQ